MHPLRSLTALVLSAALLAALALDIDRSAPAYARGGVGPVSCSGPTCTVSVSTSTSSGGGAGDPTTTASGGAPSAVQCTGYALGGLETLNGKTGTPYLVVCQGPGLNGFADYPIFLPPAINPGVHPNTPVVLAAWAASQLTVPAPVIETSPTFAQLVNVPTWLWLGAGVWTSHAATASVATVSVTALAAPVQVVWSTGDGASVTCTGPGTAWSAADGADAVSPSCGHTYHTPGSDTLTATISWRITWAGDGAAGTFGQIITTATRTVAVDAAPALVTTAG